MAVSVRLGGSLGGQSYGESSGSAGASSQDPRAGEGTSGLPSSIHSRRSEALVYKRVGFHVQVCLSWCVCVCVREERAALPSDQGLLGRAVFHRKMGAF